VGAPLTGEDFCEGVDAGFGGGGVGLQGSSIPVQRGSDVDNDTAIFAHKSFEGSLGHVESAESVNFKHSPEAISADFRSRRKEVASSAVDQNVEASELLYHNVDSILARLGLADVARDTDTYTSC